MTAEQERWAAIPGFEGRYECSDAGRVRSVPRWSKPPIVRWMQGRVLAPAPTKKGQQKRIYMVATLDGRKHLVHHLVLKTFVGPKPPGYHGCHGDDVTRNNRLDNLRWDTPTGNAADREANGHTARGERSGMAKINATTAIAIRAATGRPSQVAKNFGVSEGCVRSILRGDTWAHAL